VRLASLARRSLIPATLATLLCAACNTEVSSRSAAPTSTASGEIPITLAGIGESAVVVPVYINGRGPYDMILDTGATLTCVDATLEDELDLPERFAQFGVGATAEGVGRVRLVTIDSLRVGGERATDLGACVMDLKHLSLLSPSVRGLLGLNFLKSYRVTLDFQRRALVLRAP
jgi:predicted aspartyl protease